MYCDEGKRNQSDVIVVVDSSKEESADCVAEFSVFTLQSGLAIPGIVTEETYHFDMSSNLY